MKTAINASLFLLCLVLGGHTLSGQIWYKLELMDDGETYQISLVSEADWSLPNNLTSTGQITIKVPTLEFEMEEFENVNPQLVWDYNSRVNAPKESTDLDYLSFGLEKASRDFEYEAGEEIPIIRFKNTKGCSEYVSLLDNEIDPLVVSTTRFVNLGNQLTVVGARGNAYVGNRGQTIVKCKKLLKAKEEVMNNFVLFPNPAMNDVNIKLDWTNKSQIGHFFIRDNAGRVVKHQKAELQKGYNEIQFDISNLDGGIYHIELSNAKQENIKLERFVKVFSASIEELPTKEKKSPRNPRN